MMFTEPLKDIVDNFEGGLAGVIMGFDGIEVESYTRDGNKLDIATVAMEISVVLKHAMNAAEILEIGGMTEFIIRAENLDLLVRLLSSEYFLAVALDSDGNFGKGRYLMRVSAPKLTAELV